MHSTRLLLIGVALATGCAGATGSRGVTYGEHAGTVLVVFTNATPQKMCELRMSFDENRHLGDNWLPEDGLPSGKSAEFKVRPGKYQATWTTCKQGDTFFAGTLIADTAIGVDQQTQLYAYTADRIAPTKRAPVLTRDYKIVKFSGQPVGPIAKTAPPVDVDAFAKAEASLARGSSTPPAAKDEPRFQKFSAADYVDPKVKRTKRTKKTTAKKATKPAVKPSLARKINVGDKRVRYTAR